MNLPITPNAQQEAVLSSRERFNLVHGNAGSAKSTTLALKVIDALAQGQRPEAILALTYSEAAVAALRQRLAWLRMPAEAIRRLRIQTFDELCQQQLTALEGPTHRLAHANREVHDTVMQAIGNARLRAEQRGHLDAFAIAGEGGLLVPVLLHLFARLKGTLALAQMGNEFVLTPASAADAGADYTSLAVLQAYERLRNGDSADIADDGHGDRQVWRDSLAPRFRLADDACFDMACVLTADDPIYDAESHPLQLGIELLLVDEGHDLNRAMFTVLQALALRNPLRQLYVVGDVDQVVHSDSGADAGFMGDEFTRGIGPARTLRLDTGHRFGAALADALGRHAAKPYAVAPDKHTDIEILKVANPKALAGLIDGAFRRAAASGKAPSLAVLLRHPGAAVQLENALALRGYSTETYGFEPFARRAEILFLRSLVAWATDRLDSLANAPLAQVVQALSEFSGCMSDPQVKDRLRRSGPGSARFDNLGALREHVLGDVKQFPARGSERDRSAIINFADGAAMAALRRFVEGVRAGIAPRELERLLHDSGVAGLARRAFVFDEQVDDAIASMRDFARSAAEFDRLDAWLEQMAARDADASRGKARGAQVLRLYSIAAAKGLEFDHVVLPDVEAGRFDAVKQEERNLFYVAASRARKKLSISFGQRPSALLAAFGRESDWSALS